MDNNWNWKYKVNRPFFSSQTYGIYSREKKNSPSMLFGVPSHIETVTKANILTKIFCSVNSKSINNILTYILKQILSILIVCIPFIQYVSRPFRKSFGPKRPELWTNNSWFLLLIINYFMLHCFLATFLSRAWLISFRNHRIRPIWLRETS